MTTRRILVPKLQPVDDAHADEFRRVWQDVRDWSSRPESPALLVEDSNPEITLYAISLRTTGLLTPFESAAGPVDDPFEIGVSSIGPFIEVDVSPSVAGAPEASLSRAMALFLEQLFLAMNIAAPGCLNLWGARPLGSDGGTPPLSPDVPGLDSEQLYWSWAESGESRRWPVIVGLPFTNVWTWLSDQTFYSIEVAREPTQKALFALLQLSRRDRTDPDNVLLIVSAIENLLFGSEQLGSSRLQARLEAILGPPDEASWHARGGGETWYRGNWIKALYRPRSEIAHGSHPLIRPGWLEQIRDPQQRHIAARLQDPIDLGAAILLALLQDLVAHNATAYTFDRDGVPAYR